MTEDYCWGCDTPDNCRWCPNNKSKDRCGFCGRELPTEQAARTGRLWKELADTKKKLDIAIDFIKELDGTRSVSRENLHATNSRTLNAGNGFCWATIDEIHNTLEQINKRKKNDNSKEKV
ncbi:MAG: hypothetical protein J6S67_00460 [Methanobrevibacter sp.]|nr:hypothetical protein [Methanobrevibacter sp.]